MNGSTLFVKTPKGAEEIEKRTFGLPSRTRQLLILADGKRDVASIAEIVSVQDFDSVLSQLVKDGFLALAETQPSIAKSKPAAAVVDDFVVPADPQERLKLARTFIINTTQTFVGVFGSCLIKRAQMAQNSDDLRKLVDDWQEAISSEAGKKRTEDLKARLLALL
jgi:hypothetical protein